MAKVMISLPDDLLERVDARARERKMTRSGFLAQMARREVERPSREEMEAIIRRGREAFRDAGPFDSADLIRAERDSH